MGESGNVYIAGYHSWNAFKIAPGGAITEIFDETNDIHHPYDIAVDGAENVYAKGNSTQNVAKITPGGVITEIINATNEDYSIHRMAVDRARNVYVITASHDKVFKITGGVITEITDETGDGHGNILDAPHAITTDWAGNVYVAAQYSKNVFKITPGGVITEVFDMSGGFPYPIAIGADKAGNAYVSTYPDDKVLKVTTEPPVIHVALGDSYSSGEGAGSYGATDQDGLNLYHRSALAWTGYQPGGDSNAVAIPAASQRHSVACSGAVVYHLFYPREFPPNGVGNNAEPAQIDDEVLPRASKFPQNP